jgi:hypothetical protein
MNEINLKDFTNYYNVYRLLFESISDLKNL